MNLKVLDLFAGAGGLSLGLQEAGFHIIGAVELDLWACKTLKYNLPNCKVIHKNILNISNTEIEKDFSKNIPNVIVGGPPCQGFSISNKHAGDPKDPRNTLFQQFIRIVNVFSPKFFIMENVPHLLRAKTQRGKHVIDIIKHEASLSGYNVYFNVLNAANFGVPQNRKRLIIIGSKEPLKHPFPQMSYNLNNSIFETGLKPARTVWEAISDLPDINACEGANVMNYTKPPKNHYQRIMRNGSKKLYNHKAMNHSKRMVERFKHMPVKAKISDIPLNLRPRRRGSKKISTSYYSQNNRRMDPNKPCHTITASFYANFIHPYKNRNFTPREGARIQSFPDTYRFLGKTTVPSKSLLKKEGRYSEIHLSQYNQIGNAVPPLLAYAIGMNIKKELFNMIKGNKQSRFVNGNNIIRKIQEVNDKYKKDPNNNNNNLKRAYLKDIKKHYTKWHVANLKLKGPYSKTNAKKTAQIIKKRTKLFNIYKNFIEQKKYAKTFDSRSNLQSSALEEFMYYLFKDIGYEHKNTYVGKASKRESALKDIFVKAPDFKGMMKAPHMHEESKDVDFMIGSDIKSKFQVYGSKPTQELNLRVPAVSIECKTYVDKNMLGEIAMTSAQQKILNPNMLCIVVSEFMKLSQDINLSKSKIDQIFILRKQKNVDRKKRLNPKYNYHEKPIQSDVVLNLFNLVRRHLQKPWNGTIKRGLTQGKLI